MPDTKDMEGRVILYAGKIYGPGVVTAPTIPDVIMDLLVEDEPGIQDFPEDYDPTEYEEPTTPPPARPSVP